MKTGYMTTPRENMLKVFRHERPDWIPVTGHCDPYNQPSREGMDPGLAATLGTVRWNDTATVVFSRYLDLDIMDWFGMPTVRTTRRNVTVDSRTEGDVTTRVWHTPAGDLREVVQVCREDNSAVSSNWTEHMVKSPADLPALAAMFEAFNLDLTDARADAAHAAGKLYFHHSCGLIRDLLPLYRRTRMDAVHGFSVPPVGNVTVAEGRKGLGDRITILAGLGILSGPMIDRGAVRADIHGMIREAAPGDHFILAVAGYPNRTIEQTKFVVDCCREVSPRPARRTGVRTG